MSSKAKTILALLAAITLAGVGYFFIINRPKPEVLPPVNTPPKTKSEIVDRRPVIDLTFQGNIDAIKVWSTFYNKTVRLELKLPNGWLPITTDTGRMTPLYENIWSNRDGILEFISVNPAFKRKPIFDVLIAESGFTIDEIMDELTLSENIENIEIDGFPARHTTLVKLAQGGALSLYGEQLLIQNNHTFFFFEFRASPDEDINKSREEWEFIKSNIKLKDFSLKENEIIPEHFVTPIFLNSVISTDDWSKTDLPGYFSVKYPKELSIVKIDKNIDQDLIYFGARGEEDKGDYGISLVINVTKIKDLKKFSLEDKMDSYWRNEKIKLDSNLALKSVSESRVGQERIYIIKIYTEKNGKLYSIDIDGGSVDVQDILKLLTMEQIINSIRIY